MGLPDAARYGAGRVSLGTFAHKLDVSLSEAIDLLTELGVRSPVEYDDYLKGLSTAMAFVKTSKAYVRRESSLDDHSPAAPALTATLPNHAAGAMAFGRRQPPPNPSVLSPSAEPEGYAKRVGRRFGDGQPTETPWRQPWRTQRACASIKTDGIL